MHVRVVLVRKMSLEPLVRRFLEYLEVEKVAQFLLFESTNYLNRFLEWINANTSITSPADIRLEIIRRYRLYLAHLSNKEKYYH